MLINLRNALMTGKRLPYDAEVEYVTNLSGRATITTDIYHNTANKVEFGVMLPPVSGGQYLGTFRAYSNEQTATTRVIRNAANTGSILVNHGTIAGGGGTAMSVSNADTVLWGWTKAGEADINGVSATLSQPAVQTLSVPFEFFYTQTAGRIYRFKVENQCDLIPVRKNGAGYLYDRMSGKMYGPDSGVLSYGPDVVPVEYIESHGTEWIDTGIRNVSCNSSFSFRITASFPSGISGTSYIGSGMSSPSTYQMFYALNSSSATRLYMSCNGATNIAKQLSQDITSKHVASASVQNGTVAYEFDNESVGSFAFVTFTLPYLYLFTISGINGSISAIGNQRIFDFSFSADSEQVRAMTPIRVGSGSTWEGAMMDTLTRRIYRNSGTGAFTYGNDLPYPIPA